MTEYAYIKITPNPDNPYAPENVKLVEYDSWQFDLETLRKGADCDTINIVSCRNSIVPLGAFQYSILMTIDDNGKIFHKPINTLASMLYGNPVDFIVGDVVLGWTDPLNSEAEPDIYPLPHNIAEKLLEALQKRLG